MNKYGLKHQLSTHPTVAIVFGVASVAGLILYFFDKVKTEHTLLLILSILTVCLLAFLAVLYTLDLSAEGLETSEELSGKSDKIVARLDEVKALVGQVLQRTEPPKVAPLAVQVSDLTVDFQGDEDEENFLASSELAVVIHTTTNLNVGTPETKITLSMEFPSELKFRPVFPGKVRIEETSSNSIIASLPVSSAMVILLRGLRVPKKSVESFRESNKRIRVVAKCDRLQFEAAEIVLIKGLDR